MNIILLSGGSGKRLWPLSNDVRSKQFIKLFKDENGNYYKTSWETVTSNPLPRILMVVAFNDYNEHLAVFPSESGECNNTTEEQWRNADGELDNDMYWDMTVEGIKEIRRINGEVKAEFAIDERFILWCAVIATAALTVVAAVAVVIVAVRLKKSGK